MKMELVSIIVPIYNVAEYLDRCINSLVEQTYTFLEIILVDDGSIDGSGKLCDDWARKDSRIKVIHKSNGGLSEARNTGIEYSVGKYIIFVDSDDYIDIELVQYCYDLLNKNEGDMVIYELNMVEENFNDFIESKEKIVIEKMSGEELLYELICNGKGWVSSCNKFYSRRIWEDLRFPIGKLHEDAYVIVDIMMRANRIIVSNKKLYYYRNRSGSIMNTRSKKSFWDLSEALWMRCKKVKDNKKLYYITLNYYLNQLIEFYKVGDKKEKRTTLYIYRKRMKVSFKYIYWKSLLLLILFYINPYIYIWIVKIYK